MKIVLVFLPLFGMDMPPLGVAYIASKLIEDGHEVKLLCYNSKLFQENKDKQYLWDWDKSNEWCSLERIDKYFNVSELAERFTGEILEHKPDVVGFSVNSHSRILSNFLADKLKKKDKGLKVIFGGPWCTELTKANELSNSVDIYVRGEGEGIISNIMKKISAGESVKDLNLAGTIVNLGSGFKDNGWSSSFIDINSIPFPALHLFNFSHYTNKEEIPIIFSRGCNYACRFCTDKPMWGNYRMRRAANIIEEMKKHSSAFKLKRFKCNDLMANGDPNELMKFADLMIENKLGFSWGSMGRARPDMTQEMFNKLREGGCIYLTYGVESGAAKVLAHMGKPSKNVIAQTIKRTHLAGIKVNTLWMVGYPTEKWFDILETMLFIILNRKYIDEFVSVSSCYLPRQSWLSNQEKLLKIKHNDKSEWYRGGNTPFIRELRRRMMLHFAKRVGIYKGGIK